MALADEGTSRAASPWRSNRRGLPAFCDGVIEAADIRRIIEHRYALELAPRRHAAFALGTIHESLVRHTLDDGAQHRTTIAGLALALADAHGVSRDTVLWVHSEIVLDLMTMVARQLAEQPDLPKTAYIRLAQLSQLQWPGV